MPAELLDAATFTDDELKAAELLANMIFSDYFPSGVRYTAKVKTNEDRSETIWFSTERDGLRSECMIVHRTQSLSDYVATQPPKAKISKAAQRPITRGEEQIAIQLQTVANRFDIDMQFVVKLEIDPVDDREVVCLTERRFDPTKLTIKTVEARMKKLYPGAFEYGERCPFNEGGKYAETVSSQAPLPAPKCEVCGTESRLRDFVDKQGTSRLLCIFCRMEAMRDPVKEAAAAAAREEESRIWREQYTAEQTRLMDLRQTIYDMGMTIKTEREGDAYEYEYHDDGGEQQDEDE